MTASLTIAFMPAGKRVAASSGDILLTLARQGGVDIDSACGGRGICGRCRVIPLQPNALAPLTATEQRYAQKRDLPPGHRLSCCAQVLESLTCDVPPESRVHNAVVRKRPDERVIALDPVVKEYWLTLPEPDLHDQQGEYERLQQALQQQDRILSSAPLPLQAQLPHILQQGQRNITAVLTREGALVALYPHFVEQFYGLAIDIGSTTIAAQLCDMRTGAVLADAGAMNPQIRFGEDLMSRVSYAQMNPDGATQMRAVMVQALDALITQVATLANIDTQHIINGVLVGNPVMHHIALGFDPTSLGVAPFTPTLTQDITVSAAHMQLTSLAPHTPLYWPPLFAGHVGADAAAMLLAQASYAQDKHILLVDVGTNAEIILGNAAGLWAASSPTGPALEGAQISSGQRAAVGAIERVRICQTTGQGRIKVIGCDAWSNEAAFGNTAVTGICGSGIIEVLVEMFEAGLLAADGRIVAHPATQADGRTYKYRLHDNIYITQNDVRAVQLAKAALHAGCTLLLEQAQLTAPDAIVLAGAFGSHIDPHYARRLGLVPHCDTITSAGNAAGTGARMLLLNYGLRQTLREQVTRTKKIETALEPRFQVCFVDAMAMPASASAVVTPISDDTPTRRRRRDG